MFAIIDVETTGLNPRKDKITEIAILLYDGKKIYDSYETLVNPEIQIPYTISQLTGIQNTMVKSAPKFYEIAKKIIQLTEGKIIVGHNVRFDYKFLQKEFKEFDYEYKRKTLCTVKTSRKLIPGQASYSLSKLSANLSINHHNQHRAMGDALATASLFEHLLSIEPGIGGDEAIKLPSALSKTKIQALTHETGVYYFLNNKKEIIYVGKSIDIHQRILQHLNNYSTRKSIEMMNQIADIKYIVTGGELTALLLESDEIKNIKPLFNRAQRRSIYPYSLFQTIDNAGYYCFNIARTKANDQAITSFKSLKTAKEFLFKLTEDYELCQVKNGLYTHKGACFNYQINKCKGACIEKENPEEYNLRFQHSLKQLQFQHNNFFILEKGPEIGQKNIIKIENGIYQGFGIIDENDINDRAILHQSINRKSNNKDTQNIINSYLRHHHPDILIY